MFKKKAPTEANSGAQGKSSTDNANNTATRKRRPKSETDAGKTSKAERPPAQLDDNADPIAEPASSGNRATWYIEPFIASMYRDPDFSWPYVVWRKKWVDSKDKDGKKKREHKIDAGDDDNRMVALAQAGVGDLIYDHADGIYRYRHFARGSASEPSAEEIARLPWRNFTDISEENRALLVRGALIVMGSNPQAQLTKAHLWDSAFACLRKVARQVDSIHDDIMTLVEQGCRVIDTDSKLARSCRPGRLLFNAFPYKPRLSYSEAKFAVLVARCMMRDQVALAIRPAFGQKPLVPQLMYALADSLEGGGKSTLCRVLGGGSVGDDGAKGRYTDGINVAMIMGRESHGQHTLAARCAGKIVCEWADKNFGSMNETQSNAIKSFVNSGVISWRRMNKDAFREINWRAININTTNLQAILNLWMGIRRLPIIDLEQWREKRTAGDEVIRQNHNTGLDWVAKHRPIMLAMAFR
jgi:hypothetical protein